MKLNLLLLMALLSSTIVSAQSTFVSCDSYISNKTISSFYCLPEVDDEVLVAFNHGDLPSFDSIAQIAKGTGNSHESIAKLSQLLFSHISKSVISGHSGGWSIIGFASIGPSQFVIDRTYDYEFKLNKTVARELLKTKSLTTTGFGFPKIMLDEVKNEVNQSGLFFKIDVSSLLEKILLATIAEKVRASTFDNVGSLYSYDIVSSSPRSEECVDSNPGAMHLTSEVWNQPVVGFEFINQSSEVNFKVEIDGVACLTSTGKPILKITLGTEGDVLEIYQTGEVASEQSSSIGSGDLQFEFKVITWRLPLASRWTTSVFYTNLTTEESAGAYSVSELEYFQALDMEKEILEKLIAKYENMPDESLKNLPRFISYRNIMDMQAGGTSTESAPKIDLNP